MSQRSEQLPVEGFPGESAQHQMRKRARSNPRVTCVSCARFDGTAWCHRWNYHTSADAPICAEYRPQSG